MNVKTIPEFNSADEAEQITRALASALTGWNRTQLGGCTLWVHLTGWTVASEDSRPHVDVSTPGGHASLDRTTPDSAIAALRALGAPIDEHAEMAMVDAAFAGIGGAS